MLGVAGAYVYAPIKTLKEIEHGFKTKNVDEISKNIDFEKLKENIKRRMLDKIEQEATAKGKVINLDTIEKEVDKKIANGVAGLYLTKDGLEKLLKKSDKEPILSDDMEYSISFKDINTFIVVIKDKKENKSMPVTLKRYGLFEWKVVDMETPE
jgi:hypothetical protein